MFEKILSIGTLIVGVAMAAVIVQSPNTAPVITAGFNGFAHAVTASEGSVGRAA